MRHVYGAGIEISRSLGYRPVVRATMDEIRAVWGLVSEDPCITVSGICELLEMKRNRAWHILIWLERAGYIRRPRRQQKALQVIIPMVVLPIGERRNSDDIPETATAEVCAGNDPLPALPADLSQERQAELSPLQAGPRQPAGTITLSPG